MKIGIDVTASIYSGTGIASYYQSLVPELLKQGKQHEFVLFGYSFRRFSDLFLATKKYPFPPRLMEFLWNKLHVFPIENLIGNVDVFHAWDYLQPPTRRTKIVTTIHDMTAIKFPMYHHKSTVLAQQHRLRWVRREASAIIADSETTKQDIIDLLNIEEQRIRVIYLAAAKEYQRFFLFGKEEKELEIARVKKTYDIEGEYLLSVGTREPRKNLKRTFEAFSLLPRERLAVDKLVIVGRIGWGEQLTPPANARCLGAVKSADLPALYAGARCLIYPSLYEGFGLPVVEAMTVGCPVVTSDRGSLQEISGKAAILVDPEDIHSIVGGIEDALENHDLWSKKGIERAKEFSWQRAARETLDVYESFAV